MAASPREGRTKRTGLFPLIINISLFYSDETIQIEDKPVAVRVNGVSSV